MVRKLTSVLLVFLTVHLSFATITKMTGVAITTSTHINGASRAKACGVAIQSGTTAQWFDYQNPATADTDDAGFSNTRLDWVGIVPSQSGTCTKLRFYQKSHSSSYTPKMALYTSAGVLMGSGTGSTGTGTDNSWIEVTLTVSQSVTNGATYYVAIMNSSGGLDPYYKNGTGTLNFNGSQTYASMPFATLPSGSTIARAYCYGMWVQ